MKILVTGGAGYIGSHTCVELLNAGYEVVILDNLYNASEKAVDRIKEITGKDLTFYKADILDKEAIDPLTQGVWAVSDGGEPIDLELPSVLMLERSGENLFRHGRRIYATGIVTDKLFQLLRTQQREVELIVRDFTRVFASPEAFYAFLRRGHRIRVVHRSRLLAVTVNPTAPSGLVLDSRQLCEAMQEALQIPVYDVKKMPE